jgi:adenine-specific DNA methylase
MIAIKSPVLPKTSQVLTEHSAQDRRRLGAYYTPPELSAIVSKWAVREAKDRILEPSFGGCVFIRSVAECLKQKGSRKINTHVYGCDVDNLAFRHLKATFPGGFPNSNFPKKSFLKIRPRDFGKIKFEAVVGNPPYLSYQNMTTTQRRSALKLVEPELVLNPKASLWAYFVTHGLSFLKNGGRMGWILPGSLIFTDYGRDLLEKLATRFEQVTAIKLQQRCFGHVGTDESSVILFCEKFGPAVEGAPHKIVHALDLKECANIAEVLAKPTSAKRGKPNERILPSVDEEINRISRELQSVPGLRRLGEIADVKIGVVTGANRFFLLSQSQAKTLSIPAEAQLPFFTRFYQAAGLMFTSADIASARDNEEACILLDTRRSAHFQSVSAYLSTFDEELKQSNETFKKGSLWHQPQLGQISDSFLSYMHDSGPRLVLNKAAVYCTNSIHRVFFKAGTAEIQHYLAAIGVMSTLGQFVAEIEGRSYGSGVLKIEPSEAKRILVPSNCAASLMEAKQVATEIDKLFRASEADKARKVADSFVFHHLPALGRRVSQATIRDLLDTLRVRRSPALKLASHNTAGAANAPS